MTLTLIIIGIIAIILTLVAWFTPWSDTVVEVRSTTEVPLGSPEFFVALQSIAHSPAYPLTDKESIDILNNGDEFVPDLMKEIGSAKHSITMANYIWKDGEMANSIIDALTAKAKEGVAVRVLLDGKGSLNAPDDKLRALEEAGGKVAIFRPLGFRTLTRANKRTHVRAIVIDGLIGYTGGLSFHDEWLGDGTKPDEWRDIMFKARGRGARGVQDMFNNLWRQTDGEILTGSDFYPLLPSATIEDGCKESCIIPFFHSPSPDLEKDLYEFLWLSMAGAKDHIYLETPYLLPNKNIVDILKKKVAQGVDVEIIVPGPYVDSRVVQLASRSYYASVLDAGIKIYEYQPAHLHSKIMTADGHWSVVGSANLDNRSSALNVEGMIGVEDTKLAEGLDAAFELDRSRSKQITKEDFAATVGDRLFGVLCRLFAKQY